MLKNRNITSWLCKAILCVVSLVSVVDTKSLGVWATFLMFSFFSIELFKCVSFLKFCLQFTLLHSFNTSSSLSVILKTWCHHDTQGEVKFTANNQSMMTIFFFHVSFISLHLNAPECFFQLFCTLSEDSEAGCYIYLLSCQNYQKQHGLFISSNAWNHERSGKACMFFFVFFFQQRTRRLRWCQWGDHTYDLISFVMHPLRMWGRKRMRGDLVLDKD